MPDLSAFFPLIAAIIGAIVVVGVVWGAIKLMWKVAEPNEALIISGLTRGTLETRAGMDAPPCIANAARRFLGQQPTMESQVYNVFEGHLRSSSAA